MKNIVAALFLGSIAVSSHAQQSCANYPYTDGVNVEDVNGGTKILATASAGVSHDDIDSIKDAHEEATMEAKAAISKFLNEGIKSDSTINKIVNESKTTSGEQSERIRKELIQRVKTLSSSSQALLRGAIVLGDCYTKGREVRVSVGIKPETIKAAGKLAGSISRSATPQPAPTSTNSAPTSQSLRGMDGFSNSERLKNF